jgi:hypothetical protein
MKYITQIVACFAIFVVPFVGFAQNDTIKEVDAYGKGERKIKPTPKATLIPDLIEDTTKTQKKSEFIFYEYTASSEMKLQPISPAKLKIVDALDKLNKGYVKGGIGMYTTPLAELYYNSLRSKNSNWGVHARHISSNSSIDNTGFSGLSQNVASGFYQHYNRKNYWRGELDYRRDANHFYGFNRDEIDSADDRDAIHQAFNNIGARISTSTFQNDTGDLNYSGSLAYYNYSDKYNASENNILLNTKFKKMIKSEMYSLDFGVDFNNYSSERGFPLNNSGVVPLPGPTTSETVNNTIVKVVPSVITSGKKWYVRAGIGVFADITDATKFHFYPDVEAKYNFLDIFIPYIGINGGLQRNSFKTLTQENPFLLSQVTLQNTNTRYNVYGGVRGSITNSLSFNLQVARKSVYGQALFVNDTTYSIGNRMDVLYDSMDVTELNAQIMFDKNEKLRVYVKGKYSFFSPLNQAYVWNMPAVEVTVGGIYDLANKILVRADVYYIGERKAKIFEEIEGTETNKDDSYSISQKAFLDFNLGFEYRYSKTVSGFVNFNNILNQRYLIYYQNPVQRINIMGGATFRF